MLENLLPHPAEGRRDIPLLPGRYPLVGHAPQLYRDATALFRRGRETVGPLFRVSQGFGLWMVACTEREGFELLRGKAATNRHFRGGMPALIGRSMLGQDGAVHHHMRSSMNGPFSPRGLSASRIGEMSAQMIEERVSRWARGGELTILDEAQELTLALFFRLIGVKVADLPEWSKRYGELLHGAFPIVPRWVPGSPTTRADRARTWLDARIREIIEEERGRPPEDRFVSAVAHGTDAAESGSPSASSSTTCAC